MPLAKKYGDGSATCQRTASVERLGLALDVRARGRALRVLDAGEI